MPRPTSKKQLLQYTQENYATLQSEIAKLTTEQIIDPGTVGEWSVKDIIAHLTVWQQMTLEWYRAGKRGEKPVTPSEAFTWREIPALNQKIYDEHRNEALEIVQARFEASHHETLGEINAISEEDLFTPKVYSWTKSTTLGSYLTSATSSHYDWAQKEIRKGIKRKQP